MYKNIEIKQHSNEATQKLSNIYMKQSYREALLGASEGDIENLIRIIVNYVPQAENNIYIYNTEWS